MRPTSVIALVAGLLAALAGGVLTVLVFASGEGGRPWHYWIAPVLSIGFVVLLLAIVGGYFVRVGRLELKGRHRSG